MPKRTARKKVARRSIYSSVNRFSKNPSNVRDIMLIIGYGIIILLWEHNITYNAPIILITAAAIGSKRAVLATLVPYILVGIGIFGDAGHSNYLYSADVVLLAMLALISGLILEMKNYNNTFKSRTIVMLIILLICQVLTYIYWHYNVYNVYWFAIEALAVVAGSALLPIVWKVTNSPIPSTGKKR